ncbi:MAG: tetratricopeptide repeat protein [Phycisphaerae bacterium]
MREKDRYPKQPHGKAARAYQEGLVAFEAGRYRDAIALLSSIPEDCGLCATLARFYLGQARQRQGLLDLRAGRHTEAIRQFGAARRINPDSADLSRYLAASYAGQGRFDLAAVEYERGDAADTGDVDQPIRLAHAFARDGQMPRAVETLVKLIDAAPHRADVRLQLGLLYAAAEQYEDAVCVLQEAAELAPLDGEVRQHLGLALAAAGDHEEAVEHLAAAQRLRPQDAYLALLLTLAVDAARTTAQRLRLSLEPAGHEPAAADDGSIESLGELITREPDFVEAFLNLPDTGADKDIFAMLAAVLERALERHPDYADLYHHCARVHERLGWTDAAIFQARMAVEINPRYVQALIQLGRLYAQTDQHEAAIERLNQAIRLGGNYPDVHCLLGELYRDRGAVAQACGAFRAALSLNANYGRAREALQAAMSG